MVRRITLVLLFLIGIVLLTTIFRFSQISAESTRPQSDNTLTERQRTYLDRHTDLTKWLIALSYAMLGGLVSKSFGTKPDPRIGSFSCSIGIILLLLSLYAGFLSYESLLLLMANYPLSYIGSDLTAFPIGAQMILLLASTVALAYSFLRPPAAHPHAKE
jgi:hypothetical protein